MSAIVLAYGKKKSEIEFEFRCSFFEYKQQATALHSPLTPQNNFLTNPTCLIDKYLPTDAT